MRITMTLISLYVSLMLLSGCGVAIPIIHSEKNLATVSVGENRDEVIKKMGTPTVKASQLKDDKKIVVDQYYLYSKQAPWVNAVMGPFMLTLSWWLPPAVQAKEYWFTYIDNKLMKWDKVQTESAPVIEIDQPYVYQPYQPQPVQPIQLPHIGPPPSVNCTTRSNYNSFTRQMEYSSSCR